VPNDSTETGLQLRPPRNRVERRAIGWWTTHALALAVPAVAISVVLVTVLPNLLPGWEFWLVLAAVVIAVLAVGYLLVMPIWRYRVHRWEVAEHAVYTLSGWLWQERRIAPMSRIQTVDTTRGPLQQLFGLATVTVTTASAAGPLKIDGLDRQLAADLVEQLTAVTQANPGDAT
jgi:membrane protein YdbS with pleckstrin-like domain